MGKIITVRISEISPGEKGFSENKLTDIIQAKDSKITLPPVPVREFEGRLVNLDGRHRIIYRCLRGKSDIRVYLANHPRDYINLTSYKNILYRDTNAHILFRWDGAIYTARSLNFRGYNDHFNFLQTTHEFLKDEKRCRERLGLLN